METVLITGGTGLVGKALGQALLEKGYKVIILTRNPQQASPQQHLSFAGWNVELQTIDKEAVAAADHIIHLAGAGVAEKRWTKKRKQEIINSRVNSCKLIVDGLATIPNKVKTVISASAIGWYGADPAIPNPFPFEENAPAADNFLGNTCRQWEERIEPVVTSGKRLVKLRIGIVLSQRGGALKEFLKPIKWGVAAMLGSSRQVISWIHIDDLVNLFLHAIENSAMTGVYNAVAPKPVSNKELTLTLARSRRRFFIPVRVPAFFLQVLLGELSTEILKSATVSSRKTEAAGFQFLYPDIQKALSAGLPG